MTDPIPPCPGPRTIGGELIGTAVLSGRDLRPTSDGPTGVIFAVTSSLRISTGSARRMRTVSPDGLPARRSVPTVYAAATRQTNEGRRMLAFDTKVCSQKNSVDQEQGRTRRESDVTADATASLYLSSVTSAMNWKMTGSDTSAAPPVA